MFWKKFPWPLIFSRNSVFLSVLLKVWRLILSQTFSENWYKVFANWLLRHLKVMISWDLRKQIWHRVFKFKRPLDKAVDFLTFKHFIFWYLPFLKLLLKKFYFAEAFSYRRQTPPRITIDGMTSFTGVDGRGLSLFEFSTVLLEQ